MQMTHAIFIIMLKCNVVSAIWKDVIDFPNSCRKLYQRRFLYGYSVQTCMPYIYVYNAIIGECVHACASRSTQVRNA